MYLIRVKLPSIFVSELQTKAPLRKLVLIAIIILCQFPAAVGQQVWPGDVNNNGIVNNVDVLYWAIAKDAKGPPRLIQVVDWVVQLLPSLLWDQSFPNGVNYAYADCDGDGDVDDDDREVIESNYGRMHGEVMEDQYTIGIPESDPVLALSSDSPVVEPGATFFPELSLGSQQQPIDNFYGIAFTVTYDPNAVGDLIEDIQLEVPKDSWMHGQGQDSVTTFVKNDPELGVAEFTITRTNGESVSGFGKMGTHSIVIEEIFTGKAVISTSDIQLIDEEFNQYPVAPSELEFRVDSTLSAVVRPIYHSGIKVFPNPVIGENITIELESVREGIRSIQLYDASGRLLTQYTPNDYPQRLQFPVNEYPQGTYTFKVVTDKRLYVKSFVK